MQNCNIIFLHIPKTAGSTFNNLLHEMYPNRKKHIVLGTSDYNKFKGLNTETRKEIKLLMGHFLYAP